MPHDRGRKGGIPPRQRKSTQATRTRIQMTAGYLVSSTGKKTPSNLASFFISHLYLHILLDIPHHQAVCIQFIINTNFLAYLALLDPPTPSSCALLKETFLFVIIVIPSHLRG